MRKSKVRVGLVATIAVGLMIIPLAQSAFADYAPSFSDVVGVGSDTVQNAIGFLADGFPSGDTGYNALGNLNRVINFDATPDGNARLAYGPNGLGNGTTTSCTPGTGTTAGTGNDSTNHSGQPCTLNPTIILRAGLSPMQRPNGSGAGYNALVADMNAGHHYIDFSRASAARGASPVSGQPIDSVTIATDPLDMLKTTTPTSNAVPLSNAQLKAIYEASSPNCKKWTDVGGVSGNTIIPILPQVGSGTRSSFLGAISVTTPGNCVQTFEENDPTALFQVNTGAPWTGSTAADAIEPMSGGRLNLFKGLLGNGSSNGYGGYYFDPSCPAQAVTPAPNCTTNAVLNPQVAAITTGNPSDGNPRFHVSRPLYVYFRDADVGNTAPFGADHPFQPGSTLNWVRTLFYNPCSSGQTGCAGGFGPGGAPYVDTSAGQALIEDAGLVPTYAFTFNGP